MEDTIFHKILRKEIPANVVLETDEVLAFTDISPQDRTHILFIPKEHLAISSIKEAVDDKVNVPAVLIESARAFAEQQEITGYKLQFNVGKEGGQEVPYIHLHLISSQAIS